MRTLEILPKVHQEFIKVAVYAGLLLLAILAIFVFHVFGP